MSGKFRKMLKKVSGKLLRGWAVTVVWPVRFAIIASILLVFCRPLEAKTNRDLTYHANQLWNTAIRFIRVDMECPVIEKDKKAGYLLFEYKGTSRSCQGSLEFVPVEKEKRAFTTVKLNIGCMPAYVETVIFDKFMGKLREEHGDPPLARVVDSNAQSPAAENQEAKSKATSKKASENKADQNSDNEAGEQDAEPEEQDEQDEQSDDGDKAEEE